MSSIWDANEAFYAQTPREMIETGDYVTPSFNFQLRMNKPVLSYWNVAASYHLFGISEWSERLPIAIGALVIIGTAFGLGRLLGGTFAGLFAALVLATSPRLMLLARRIIIDIHITMWMGLVLLFFALAETRPQRRRLYLCLMYVAAGFGVLTKGPVAVFLPAVVFFIYLASQKRLGDLRHMMLPTGALISLAIVVPWYYLLYREHGWEYIGSFIFGENLGRYAEAVGEQSRGLLFYIPVMLADLFPWSLMIPVALWWAIRGRRQDRVRATARRLDRGDRRVLFALGHEGRFVHPSDRAGRGRADWRHARQGHRKCDAALRRRSGQAVATSGVHGATAVLLLVTGSAALWVFAVTDRYSLDGAALVGCDGPRWRARRSRGAVPPPGVRIDRDDGDERCRHRLVHRAVHAARFRALQASQAVLRHHSIAREHRRDRRLVQILRCRAWSSICTGPSWKWCYADHLRAVFYSSSDVYFIMAEDEYNSIKDRLPVETYVLARQQMFDLRPKNFLDGSELPQFVLVSNRD